MLGGLGDLMHTEGVESQVVTEESATESEERFSQCAHASVEAEGFGLRPGFDSARSDLRHRRSYIHAIGARTHPRGRSCRRRLSLQMAAERLPATPTQPGWSCVYPFCRQGMRAGGALWDEVPRSKDENRAPHMSHD